MKRIATFFVALTMALSLAACSGNQAAPSSEATSPNSLTVVDNSSSSSTPASSSMQESSSAPESSSASESTPEESVAPSSEPEISSSQPVETPSSSEPEASQPETTPETPKETSGTKVLVAYFSATNTTEGVAEKIAAGVNGELYEITPAEPYTSADLNYHDDNSRTTIEMNDPSARPAISGSVADMAQYDVVFLGYPIWWGEAPRIMSTFIESYDFSGKTLVAFCTSGGSGFGGSDSALKSAASSASWLEGRRFSGSASQSEIDEWVNGLGLNLQ